MDFDCDNSYDMVLALESFSKLKEGFEIIYTKKGKYKYNELKEEKEIVITAIGNSRKNIYFIKNM